MCNILCFVKSLVDFSIVACSACGFVGREESYRQSLGSVVLYIWINICMHVRSLVE